MAEEIRIRYGDFRRETRVDKRVVSYSRLTRLAAQRRAEIGGPRWRRVKLTPLAMWHLLSPYLSSKAGEQLRAVVPLAGYLAVFQLLVLHRGIAEPWVVLGGLVATLAGLMLFMEGLRLGLMPLGEAIGHDLPRTRTLPVVLGVAFALGVGVTFAEPAIGALKAAGSLVEAAKAPYLHALLNAWSPYLVLAVGAGVGVAAVVGMLMFLRAWSLKGPIYLLVGMALLLTALIAKDDQLAAVIGLAWDCGAVTTGPVTVPLVLALGIGVAGSAGKGDSALAGFGIVTMASVLPIIAVLLLGLVLSWTHTPAEAAALGAEAGAAAWFERSPWAEIVGSVRAIVPLVAFLALVARLARAKVCDRAVTALGVVFALAGMVLFNIGLTYGLANLGAQSGTAVPGAFAALDGVAGTPMYDYALGVGVAVLFAWALGFGATIAEPALNAMGQTVETLSNGAFRKSMLITAVSGGVACGIALGVVKLVFALPLWWFLLPGYMVALLMTWASSEAFTNVAWDSAGVTTGPVTVPLVLAMGLGFGGAVGAIEGFGVLALASLGPIIAVLGLGLAIRLRQLRLPAAAPVPKAEEATL
ncbi:MAG: DUF1538 domain-containing protein [Pseudomonadota bacterium]